MSGEITLTIGRGSARHIRFDDGTVSRNHATLTIRSDGTYLLADAGSTHGTKVSGQEIKGEGSRRIRHNDVIEFGHMRISAQDLQRRAAEAWRRQQQTRPVPKPVPPPNQSPVYQPPEPPPHVYYPPPPEQQPQAAGPMTFGRAISTCLHKYVNFTDRASRGEFWFFWLFNMLVNTGFGILFAILAAAVIPSADDPEAALTVLIVVVGGLYLVICLGLFLPFWGALARRLHDINKSGWYLLLFLIPFGCIVLLIMAMQPGTSGPNDYGPDPLGGEPPRYDVYYNNY